ncbi:MAG: rhodanese-like domain-containing protein [Anaerolineales bacterium]
MPDLKKYPSFLWVGLLGGWLIACGARLPQTDITPRPSTPTVTVTSTAESVEESIGENVNGYTNIAPSELAAMLEEKDFLLINTHAPYGFEIEHTDAHIPLDEEGEWLHRYPDDKTTKIVLYCRSAHWSTIAAQELVTAGYTNVWHLDGGMVAWDAAGLPLATQ